ncbi:MAG TPA: hypothetical protein VGF89_00885 [Steroidobacteraceae bacterium]
MIGKAQLLHAAEILDSLRIFPRLFVGTYTVWGGGTCWQVLHWYFAQPAAERTVQDAGLVTSVVTVLVGFLTTMYRTYSDSGRDWNARPVDPMRPQP